MGGWDWLWIPAVALCLVGYVLLLSRAANRGSLRGPVKLALANRNLSRGMSPLGVKRLACRPPLCGLVG